MRAITVARKPISEGNVARNVLRWGTGSLNIGASRIRADASYEENAVTQGGDHFSVGSPDKTRGTKFQPNNDGRWPPNLILQHTSKCREVCSPGCPVADLDRKSLDLRCSRGDSSGTQHGRMKGWSQVKDGSVQTIGYGTEEGTAARFFKQVQNDE